MKIIIADLETTGFSKDDKVVEVAMVECTLVQREADSELIPGVVYDTLINPVMPIPEASSAIHGIRAEHVQDAPTISRVLPLVFTSMFGIKGKESFLLIGHNFPAFDMRFIDGRVPKEAEVCCSMKAARKLVTTTTKFGLDHLRQHLALAPQLKHSALGDCYSTIALLNYMLSFGTSWDRLVDLMSERPTTISFGKHKGQRLDCLEESYIEWLLSGDCDSASWELKRALREL